MDGPATWTKATPPHLLGRVLRPDELLERARVDRVAPDPRLAPWVESYWSVRWALAEGESAPQATVSETTAHLTVERGGVTRDDTTGSGVWVTGPVTTGRFDVSLSGTGSVVGVKFRPGGLHAFADVEPGTLADRTVPASEVLGDVAGLDRLPDGAGAAARGLDAWLLDRGPRSAPDYGRFAEVQRLIEETPVVTLDALAGRAGCSVRTVQRLVRRYSGTGVKRLLVRARVREAVAAIDGGGAAAGADLAARLGWFDQTHFIRDFRAVTGHTPAAYAARRARRA